MKLYLLFDIMGRETEKAYIVYCTIHHIADISHDFQINTKSNRTIYASEMDSIINARLCIPKSVCRLLTNDVLEIEGWFYLKNIANGTVKINKSGESVEFKEIQKIWIKRNRPEYAKIPNLFFTEDDSDDFVDPTEDDLRDNSHLLK